MGHSKLSVTIPDDCVGEVITDAVKPEWALEIPLYHAIEPVDILGAIQGSPLHADDVDR